jgi:hypothetical protein
LVGFIPYKRLIEAWRRIIGGLGSVKVVKIDDPDNIGRYLSKYILKEFASVEKYKRVYIPSIHLKKPDKYTIGYAEFKAMLPKLRQKKAIVDGEEKIVAWYW